MSLLSYFPCYGTNISVSTMISCILEDEQLANDFKDDIQFPKNLEQVRKMNKSLYDDVYVKAIYDDNLNSGVVFYIFETSSYLIYAFRGSEALDDANYTTGWQDWMDNFRMFLKYPTYQQILTLQKVQADEIKRPFYLCGHSKGGNLALFTGLTMKDEAMDAFMGIVSFNAPGITKPIYASYQKRAEESSFLNKITLFENENDCISSYFEHLKEPILIKSELPCGTLEELYHNHNLYAMDFTDNHYIIAEKKSAIPKLVYHFVNDFFVNLKEERLERVVARMDDYFLSGLSMNELYRVFIYHISKYTSLFEDISYEEVRDITIHDLIERRKSKLLLRKLKEIDPQAGLKKIADTIVEKNPIPKLNEMDIKNITQGIVDNYDLLVQERKKELQLVIAMNNEKIIGAIKAIRNREKES